MKFVEVVKLSLDSNFELILNNIFYVPSFRRNLIIVLALEKQKICSNFSFDKVDLFLNSIIVG